MFVHIENICNEFTLGKRLQRDSRRFGAVNVLNQGLYEYFMIYKKTKNLLSCRRRRICIPKTVMLMYIQE